MPVNQLVTGYICTMIKNKYCYITLTTESFLTLTLSATIFHKFSSPYKACTGHIDTTSRNHAQVSDDCHAKVKPHTGQKNHAPAFALAYNHFSHIGLTAVASGSISVTSCSINAFCLLVLHWGNMPFCPVLQYILSMFIVGLL